MSQNLVILLFSFLLIAIATGVTYDLSRNQAAQLQTPLFSERVLLESMWERYKVDYLETGTYRTLDPQLENITTSEGQSYTMLRAVWMDDQATFRQSWVWTRDNLQKEPTALFAWRFGERPDGSYGVQTSIGGNNSASDADVDIALALLLAHARWGKEEYLTEARAVIADIWEHEVVPINGRPYLLSNDLDKALNKDLYHLNPSYYAPYAFRVFADVDPSNDWLGLVDTTYYLLNQSTVLPLGSSERGALPPDWVRIDSVTGALLPPSSTNNYSTRYSYDAVRVPWRIAMDHRWFGQPEAAAYLHTFSTLKTDWENRGRLAAEYSHVGEPLVTYGSPTMYATSLGYLSVHDQKTAEALAQKKLVSLYNIGRNDWYDDPGYYSNNWVWFGLALHFRLLENYTEDISYITS